MKIEFLTYKSYNDFIQHFPYEMLIFIYGAQNNLSLKSDYHKNILNITLNSEVYSMQLPRNLEAGIKGLINQFNNIPNIKNNFFSYNLKPIEWIEFLKKTFKSIIGELTVLIESKYVDRIHLNEYSSFFSQKHFNGERDTFRLIFFSGNLISFEKFLQTKEKKLNNALIGSVVFRPLLGASIGRTLLNPKKLGLNMYVRLAKFTINICGKKLEVDAYPFMTQDSQLMSCSEISSWTIFEYFGTRYSKYRIISPSQIYSCTNSRLPTDGMTIEMMENLFRSIGFSPVKRLSFKTNKQKFSSDIKKIKIDVYTYVESGFPVLLTLADSSGNLGHAVVCIGHTQKIPYENFSNEMLRETRKNIKFIDTCHLINYFVIIDDNCCPYEFKNIDALGKYEHLKINGYIAPLDEDIHMLADEASAILFEVFENEILGLTADAINLASNIKKTDKYSDANPVVMRIFLTTGKAFKRFRIENTKDIKLKKYYCIMDLPRFIWVAEISLKNLLLKKEPLTIGEIILDATSTSQDYLHSLIAINYPNFYLHRDKNEIFDKMLINFFEKKEFTKNKYKINFCKQYVNNLER